MIASTIREPGTMYGDDGPIGEPDLLGKKKPTCHIACHVLERYHRREQFSSTVLP